MKAARFSQFGGPEVLEIVDLPEPHAGPGLIRVAVRAVGVNATDWKLRQGPARRGAPADDGSRGLAGIVDEVVRASLDVAVGDRVFGVSPDASGAADLALALLLRADPAVAWLRRGRCAARRHRDGHARPGCARVGAGSHAARQRRHRRGRQCRRPARRRPRCARDRHRQSSQPRLPALAGRRPVAYGEGLGEQVRALAPDGVDEALDVAGSGVLPELIELAGGPEHVVTLSDFVGAQEHGVKFSRGG